MGSPAERSPRGPAFRPPSPGICPRFDPVQYSYYCRCGRCFHCGGLQKSVLVKEVLSGCGDVMRTITHFLARKGGASTSQRKREQSGARRCTLYPNFLDKADLLRNVEGRGVT